MSTNISVVMALAMDNFFLTTLQREFKKVLNCIKKQLPELLI
jgi:hypothetical protein